MHNVDEEISVRDCWKNRDGG